MQQRGRALFIDCYAVAPGPKDTLSHLQNCTYLPPYIVLHFISFATWPSFGSNCIERKLVSLPPFSHTRPRLKWRRHGEKRRFKSVVLLRKHFPSLFCTVCHEAVLHKRRNAANSTFTMQNGLCIDRKWGGEWDCNIICAHRWRKSAFVVLFVFTFKMGSLSFRASSKESSLRLIWLHKCASKSNDFSNENILMKLCFARDGLLAKPA